MQRVANQFERLFGRSQNGQVAELLVQQADIAVRCAILLRESQCAALSDVVSLEREGDVTQEQVHEIIDRAFILRFDKSDIGNLSNRLDNILDGMRQVAKQVDIYRPHMKKIRQEADDLIKIIEEMTSTVRNLVATLKERHLLMTKVKECTQRLKKLEAEADDILHAVEADLVKEYDHKRNNALEFMAHDKIFRLLEHVTDVADHCGTLVLSIARKEA